MARPKKVLSALEIQKMIALEVQKQLKQLQVIATVKMKGKRGRPLGYSPK